MFYEERKEMENEMNTHIEVSAEVRYWEDATVNGIVDTDGTLIPNKRGSVWCPVIRLADGLVKDWPAGTTADVHYKVCDSGEYWLQDDSGKRVAKWSGFYVPNDFLCPEENGYGDYIILRIGADGIIKGWKQPEVMMVCTCGESDETGWEEIK